MHFDITNRNACFSAIAQDDKVAIPGSRDLTAQDTAIAEHENAVARRTGGVEGNRFKRQQTSGNRK